MYRIERVAGDRREIVGTAETFQKAADMLEEDRWKRENDSAVVYADDLRSRTVIEREGCVYEITRVND